MATRRPPCWKRSTAAALSFMSASTIIVAANAQLLGRVKLRPDDHAEPPEAKHDAELAAA